KTRLAAAIAALGLDRGATVLAARCSESEQVLPFAPWVDALRAGISGLDVSERLGRVWRLELARLFPELGEPGLVSVTDRDGYLRLFEAVALLVGSLATERLRASRRAGRRLR